MVDSKKVVKQMVDFNKATFDNTFNALIMLQEQAERMANTMLEQANWMPEEGRKAISDWVGAYKKGRTEFKGMVDESFAKVEEFFEKFEK
jgi:polyhydroxyalkanoate synthesis regulator phasin